MNNTFPTLTCRLPIDAAADATVIGGVAYDGDVMTPNVGGNPVRLVVDLATLKIPERTPLLVNHDQSLAGRIGEISATVAEGKLSIAGKITSDSYDAWQIVGQARRGAVWELSIGTTGGELFILAEGKTLTVNGREFAGPLNVYRNGELTEVSVVNVGASRKTALTLAASLRGMFDRVLETIAGVQPAPQPEDTTMPANDNAPDLRATCQEYVSALGPEAGVTAFLAGTPLAEAKAAAEIARLKAAAAAEAEKLKAALASLEAEKLAIETARAALEAEVAALKASAASKGAETGDINAGGGNPAELPKGSASASRQLALLARQHSESTKTPLNLSIQHIHQTRPDLVAIATAAKPETK